MKWLLWKAPSFIHELILKLTGWRLYQITTTNGKVVERGFTKKWPLPSHPMDDKFPVVREVKLN